MRPTLVNGLARLSLIVAVTIVPAACSQADGHPGGAAVGSGSNAPSAAPQSSGASASGNANATAGTATDSIAKLADASRILGSPSAKLWVIEVSDFQCPYCKEWHDQSFAMVLNDYVKTGKVRLAYVNFPLPMHQHALEAATAAMCAGAQGKFWQMHDALFATQGKWESAANTAAIFDSLARAAGANDAQYRTCLTSPAISALVAGDQDRAQRGGVQSTPSFWVGNKLIEGAVPAATMRAAIDEALATAK